MRSMLEIICAVKDSKPVTEEELRMTVLGMSAMKYFIGDDLDKLIDAVEKGDQRIIKFRATTAKKEQEIRFTSMKMDVLKYLGPRNIPGNKEYEERMRMSRKIFKDATGQDL